jgi:hypothetical protein
MSLPLPALTRLGLGLAVGAIPASAATTTPNADAFDLAAAFVPAPVSGGATVTGVFTETSHSSQTGTFADGALTVGFNSGVVLSTGDVSQIGGASPLSSGFGGTPGAETSALLAQIPGLGSDYSDPVRFSLEVNPGILNNYVNFAFGYRTSEISPGDRFGVFVDGQYRGLLLGQPTDQAHPWMAAAVPDIGYTQALYDNGNPLDDPALILSLAVPSPGVSFTLDFVLADLFGDQTDTAAFLGEFSASETPQGHLAVPEVGAWPMVTALGLGAIALKRRRMV